MRSIIIIIITLIIIIIIIIMIIGAWLWQVAGRLKQVAAGGAVDRSLADHRVLLTVTAYVLAETHRVSLAQALFLLSPSVLCMCVCTFVVTA